MPKVTVAIPTYNREEYLKDCLKSVLVQSFQDFEIVIFDNHSDYDVKEFVKQFNDERIKVLVNETNFGAASNFNKIFEYNFDSPYLVVFHDDDTMHPDLLSKEVVLMDNNENMIFVATAFESVANHDLMFNFAKNKKDDNVLFFTNHGDLVRLILKRFNFCFSSAMYRAEKLNGIDKYFKQFSKWCDRPFLIDLTKKGTVTIIKEKLINSRVHEGQDTQTSNTGRFHFFENLINYYKDCLPQPLSGQDKKLFYNWSTNEILLSITSFSSDFKGHLKLLKKCYKNGLFDPRYFNIRSLYYFLTTTKRIFKFFK